MILYKYVEPARIDVLQNRMIRFTQPAAFNDPFECRPYFGSLVSRDFIEAALESRRDEMEAEVIARLAKQGVTGPAARELFHRFRPTGQAAAMSQFFAAVPVLRTELTRILVEKLNAELGILCLTEVRDSILMWGHYTNGHSGFVIGFDDAHPFFSRRRSPQDEFGFLRKVTYRRDRPELRFDTISETISIEMFQTKSEEWAYEKEWRMMRVLSDATRRDEAIPHDVCLFTFEPDALKEIIVGARADPSLISAVRQLQSTFPRAGLFAAREHPSEYAIVVEPLH